MGFWSAVSSGWKAVKAAAKSALRTVLEFGGRVVEKVKQTWQATKEVVKRAAEWVAGTVEKVASAVAKVARSVIEQFKVWMGIDEATLEAELVAKLVGTVNAIIAAAEAVTAGEELTSFYDYMQATAALRVARSWLKKLTENGAGGLDEPGLAAMKALTELFVEGNFSEEVGMAALDAYCRSFMPGNCDFDVLGAETIQETWVAETDFVEGEITRFVHDIDNAEELCAILERRKDIQGTADAQAEKGRLERIKTIELEPRAIDLAIASQTLEGIICDETGEETDLYMRKYAIRAAEALRRWQIAGKMEGADRDLLTDFASCYRLRAGQRAARTRNDMGSGPVGPTPTPVG